MGSYPKHYSPAAIFAAEDIVALTAKGRLVNEG